MDLTHAAFVPYVESFPGYRVIQSSHESHKGNSSLRYYPWSLPWEITEGCTEREALDWI